MCNETVWGVPQNGAEIGGGVAEEKKCSPLNKRLENRLCIILYKLVEYSYIVFYDIVQCNLN